MWEIRTSAEVYANPWIRVLKDAVIRPDGTPGIYGVVEVRRPSVFVVALTDSNEVLLVTVDRHTTGSSIELPAGGADADTPLVAAQRELAEETGWRASQWREVGRMNALNGICRAPEHVFLATGLHQGEATGQHEEGITDVRAVPWPEVLAMVSDGRITDGETVAALLYAAMALGRVA